MRPKSPTSLTATNSNIRVAITIDIITAVRISVNGKSIEVNFLSRLSLKRKKIHKSKAHCLISGNESVILLITICVCEKRGRYELIFTIDFTGSWFCDVD